MGYIAVIDTETNWYQEVMSVGVVIANDNKYEKIDELYYVFDPEYKVGGMFQNVLGISGKHRDKYISSRKEAMKKIISLLQKYETVKIFAYNASFDKRLLNELSGFAWYDIIKIAAYKQYNDKIPDDIECCKTGRMKCNYGVEPMMRLISNDKFYNEKHNALRDARDELKIMKLLGKTIVEYEIARI